MTGRSRHVEILRAELAQTCDAQPMGYPCAKCGKASIMHAFKQELALRAVRLQQFESAIAANGIVEDAGGTLRWVFQKGVNEVSSSGGDAGSRLDGVLRQTRYVVDGLQRRLSASRSSLEEVEASLEALGVTATSTLVELQRALRIDAPTGMRLLALWHAVRATRSWLA